MKILIVVHSLHGGGGAERVVSLLSREWAKSHEVTIALFDASETAYDYGGRIVSLRDPIDTQENPSSFIRKTYNKTHDVNMRSIPLLDLIQRKILGIIKYIYNVGKYIYNIGMYSVWLLSLLRREHPDRIISFLEGANIPATIASALTGSRCLLRLTVSVRNNPAREFSFKDRLLGFLLYRLPARVVAVSEGVKRGLASICRLPTERILFIPNPVVVKNAQDAARETTPPLPERYVLGVGRLASEKGFERLVRAFHRLDRPTLHLAIVGEGPERVNLLRLACELGLESRLHLPGHVADVETWYRHAACFVLSSRYEGWPNVLGEALANGCPVVSFDCDHGPSEILEDGKYGLLVPEGDVAALTGEIVRVLDDDALRRALAAKGPERARMFNLEKIASRWLEADVGGGCA